MKTQHHNATPRTVYVIEDKCGETFSASRDETEARIIGESLAEFDEARDYYLRPYTLQ